MRYKYLYKYCSKGYWKTHRLHYVHYIMNFRIEAVSAIDYIVAGY